MDIPEMKHSRWVGASRDLIANHQVLRFGEHPYLKRIIGPNRYSLRLPSLEIHSGLEIEIIAHVRI